MEKKEKKGLYRFSLTVYKLVVATVFGLYVDLFLFHGRKISVVEFNHTYFNI